MKNILMRDLADFYKDKNVFITGGTGFKGSWLCLLLKKLGAHVTDYSLMPPSSPALWDLASIEQEIETHTRADIIEREKLKEAISLAKPDIIIHLAAQSLVRPSYDMPYDTLETNIMGTVSLLDASLLCDKALATLIITSDKAYENINKPHPYKEDDRMGGYDPYSVSKGCAELVTSAYRNSFFDVDKKGLASIRAGNVIGGGDFAKDRLIPDMVRSFTQNKSVHIRYPKATRPWQHVLEPLVGYLMLAKDLYLKPAQYSEAWNFGPLNNEAHTVEDVIKIFSSFWGAGASYEIDDANHPHEAAFLGLDCQKANERLLWQPRLTFEEGVKLTAIWYKEWYAGKNPLTLCKEQIDYFLAK